MAPKLHRAMGVPVSCDEVLRGKYEEHGAAIIAARLDQLGGRRNQRRNYKGYFVSPDGDSWVGVWLGLEAVFFDEAEQSILVHL